MRRSSLLSLILFYCRDQICISKSQAKGSALILCHPVGQDGRDSQVLSTGEVERCCDSLLLDASIVILAKPLPEEDSFLLKVGVT